MHRLFIGLIVATLMAPLASASPQTSRPFHVESSLGVEGVRLKNGSGGQQRTLSTTAARIAMAGGYHRWSTSIIIEAALSTGEATYRRGGETLDLGADVSLALAYIGVGAERTLPRTRWRLRTTIGPTWVTILSPHAIGLTHMGVGVATRASRWLRFAPGLYGGVQLSMTIRSARDESGRWTGITGGVSFALACR